MNTKVAVAMLLLIVIASTAMLMESNEVYSHNNSNVQLKAFGNSTILYHNSTYIMGKMDGLYFTDIYNNGWHYTILNSAPAINSSISDAVISDKIVEFPNAFNCTLELLCEYTSLLSINMAVDAITISNSIATATLVFIFQSLQIISFFQEYQMQKIL